MCTICARNGISFSSGCSARALRPLAAQTIYNLKGGTATNLAPPRSLGGRLYLNNPELDTLCPFNSARTPRHLRRSRQCSLGGPVSPSLFPNRYARVRPLRTPRDHWPLRQCSAWWSVSFYDPQKCWVLLAGSSLNQCSLRIVASVFTMLKAASVSLLLRIARRVVASYLRGTCLRFAASGAAPVGNYRSGSPRCGPCPLPSVGSGAARSRVS